jgi:hypothetical protein
MSSLPRPVDLTQVPAVPWAWVDEHVYAAIRGCSVKVLQNERRLNMGCPFRRINGTSIRYKLGDITTFLELQPRGGGAAKPSLQPRTGPGRPRKSSARAEIRREAPRARGRACRRDRDRAHVASPAFCVPARRPRRSRAGPRRAARRGHRIPAFCSSPRRGSLRPPASCRRSPPRLFFGPSASLAWATHPLA